MLKPPRPGSMGATVPFPPPPSCSPLSGKSSSNTKTESFPVGSGVGTTFTITGAKAAVLVGVQVADVEVLAKMLQAGGIGAPPIVWPQFVFSTPPTIAPAVQSVGAPRFPAKPELAYGLPASPGNIEM